jgi:hypothetical protein
MASITVDDATASLLRWVNQPVKIVDGEGRWIGSFTPADKGELGRQIEVPDTDRETRRLIVVQGLRVLAGILAELGEHASEPSPSRDGEVPFTDEELDRFEQEPGGQSLDEILRGLGER